MHVRAAARGCANDRAAIGDGSPERKGDWAMSKAFTREDDADQQGDLLPERAIPPHPNLVTAEGWRRSMMPLHGLLSSTMLPGPRAMPRQRPIPPVICAIGAQGARQLSSPNPQGDRRCSSAHASPSGGRMDRPEPTALLELMRQIPRKGRCLTSHPLPRH